jgi:hypothetical protein
MPILINDTVNLSGTEQIVLIVMKARGGPRGGLAPYVRYFEKGRKIHGDDWANDWIGRAQALRRFERDNRIRFIVEGSSVEGFVHA